jgi:cyclopropane fatty-acyl-phospholipid synthase-like methyltransferase
MNACLGSFDKLASIYEWLERLAFGSDLEAARYCYLEHLRGCRRVLVLGEGDGRFLVQLVRRFPDAYVDCVDASGAMLAKAKGRLKAEEIKRVTFRQEDARLADFETSAYDAIVTLFFLDCFSAEEAAGLINRVKVALHEDGRWLWADFALPSRGWKRWRAAIWLRGLYMFFRWQTRMSARRLPPMEGLLRAAGFNLRAEKIFQANLLRSAVFERARSDALMVAGVCTGVQIKGEP